VAVPGQAAARPGEVEVEEGLKPFRFYGPTCDHRPHARPVLAAGKRREGDYIEIGMLGAYGVAMSTRFNGFGENETVESQDAPMASMYGLAKRSIPCPQAESEERKVVRFSRPKGKAGKRKRRR
jgi:ornithine decarboxylase